MDINVDLTHE